MKWAWAALVVMGVLAAGNLATRLTARPDPFCDVRLNSPGWPSEPLQLSGPGRKWVVALQLTARFTREPHNTQTVQMWDVIPVTGAAEPAAVAELDRRPFVSLTEAEYNGYTGRLGSDDFPNRPNQRPYLVRRVEVASSWPVVTSTQFDNGAIVMSFCAGSCHLEKRAAVVFLAQEPEQVAFMFLSGV